MVLSSTRATFNVVAAAPPYVCHGTYKASVENEILRGHVAGLMRRQERDDMGNLICCSESRQRPCALSRCVTFLSDKVWIENEEALHLQPVWIQGLGAKKNVMARPFADLRR